MYWDLRFCFEGYLVACSKDIGKIVFKNKNIRLSLIWNKDNVSFMPLISEQNYTFQMFFFFLKNIQSTIPNDVRHS